MHVLDWHDSRILRGRSPCHRDQGLAGRIGDQVEVKIACCMRHGIECNRSDNLSMTGEKAMAFPGVQAI